ncbi:plakophilin-2 [Gouania willdenowi]|uniref:Plakophilin 2 n=1 Tax=Gouania willdenowi TaxID=441366 RepID=A0A8C5HLK1_GOUWI|nr:plakophilin-2 [Gouania willdenowi]
MDDVFFKSALPLYDSPRLGDTSLALPADGPPRFWSSVDPDPTERSQRVQQQVQLTLARKARRTVSNGGVHLQASTGRSFDASDGYKVNMKVNGSGPTQRSLSTNYVQSPSRRVEVSPPPSPEFSRSRFNTLRFNLHSLPCPSHSYVMSSLQYSQPRSDSFQRYAFSEAPRGTRLHSLAPVHASTRQRPLLQSSGTQSMFGNLAYQRNTEHGSRVSHKQSAVHQQRHGGDTMPGAGQQDDGLTWLAQLRSNTNRSLRLKSYPPSTNSVEVDALRHGELEIPVQKASPQKMYDTRRSIKSENKLPEMTLERAVSLLSQNNEDTLISAASFIQNQCFLRADAKRMVYYLHGIGKLLQLLSHDSEDVQRVTAGALRNVVYQSSENKMEVKDNDGVVLIVNALGSSHDMETRRQLTGVLWNLSSHDLLKDRLSKETLSVLTRSVLVPSSGISEGENPKHELLADAESFHSATGCLRNLSSAGPEVRKAMRKCENLIDSLVYYIRGTVANRQTDDKSTENCTCILHNLSYQIESELPPHYAQEIQESRQNSVPKPKTVGCFSYRSANIKEEQERQRPLLEEKANPCGIEWLWSPITVRMYLSLIACSTRHCTQEAAIGAMQNITAGNSMMTEAIAFTIIQRENGLQHVKKVLSEGNNDVKKSVVLLIRNLSRYQELLPDIATQVLPEVVQMLPSDHDDLPTEVTAALCQILNNLSQTDIKHVKAIVNHRGLQRIIHISDTDDGRAGHAAGVLLQTMWRHNDLHRALRKGGFKKSDFINSRTTRAVNSG